MLPRELIVYGARLFGCTPAEIVADNRRVRVHRARLALYLSFWLRAEARGTPTSYKAIGRLVGGRDHSTIIHGLKRARSLAENDAAFAQKVLTLLSAKEVPPVEKAACKPPLQEVDTPDQQQEETKMALPEQTEARINDAFKRAGMKAFEAYWNGGIVSEADPATFDVYVHGAEVDLVIRDYGSEYILLQRLARSRLSLGKSATLSGIVDLTRDSINRKQKEAA